MAEQDPIHPEPLALNSSESAGKILSSARIAWDLSIEDVAHNLNLGVDTILALEQDEYEKLPGYTFVKGYLRSYANLLKLDPEEVVANVDLQPERLSEIPSIKGSLKLKGKTNTASRKNGSAIGAVFKSLLFIVLLAGLVLFGLNQYSKMDKDKLAEFFKLPASESTKKTTNSDIVLPTASGEAENGKKEALIRIE